MDEFQRLMQRYPDLRALYTRRLVTSRRDCSGCEEDRLREEFLKIARGRFRRDNPRGTI